VGGEKGMTSGEPSGGRDHTRQPTSGHVDEARDKAIGEVQAREAAGRVLDEPVRAARQQRADL